jgi:phosphotransferase system HPr (HPr) family protein
MAPVSRGAARRGERSQPVTSVEVEVRNESGLHARPAAAFVRTAIGFSSIVRLENVTLGRPAANAKSLVGVLGSAVEKGHRVRISAEGSDERAAVDTLSSWLGMSDTGGRAGDVE